jgi:hypothetical protein
MKVTHRLFGALAATLLVAAQAMATPILPELPEGTPIIGEPSSLLAYDASLNDYVSGASTAVSDTNIEFLTEDFALGLDFQSSGLLRLWDNLGTGVDYFNYDLRFSFPGLEQPLYKIWLQDTSFLTGGNIFVNILDNDTFELLLRDVQFSPGFTYADIGVSVDEPATLSLLMIGMLATLALRRRSAAACNNIGSEVAP